MCAILRRQVIKCPDRVLFLGMQGVFVHVDAAVAVVLLEIRDVCVMFQGAAVKPRFSQAWAASEAESALYIVEAGRTLDINFIIGIIKDFSSGSETTLLPGFRGIRGGNVSVVSIDR